MGRAWLTLRYLFKKYLSDRLVETGQSLSGSIESFFLKLSDQVKRRPFTSCLNSQALKYSIILIFIIVNIRR
jgi:hypothetical protein